MRHNYRFNETSHHWTAAHLKWLRTLKTGNIYQEILEKYLFTIDNFTNKLERLDKRIEELATDNEYKEKVSRFSCFHGIKILTALSVIVEVGDFKRFSSAQHFVSYIGLVPSEDSNGGDQNHLSITKAGNRQVRMILLEAAQSFSRGQVGHKSKVLKERQSGNTPAVIAYADLANERLRRRYYKLVLGCGKKRGKSMWRKQPLPGN